MKKPSNNIDESTPLSIKLSSIKYERFLPWLIAGVYVLLMGLLAAKYHTAGGLEVETDFFAELVPQAKKLLAFEFSPLNYSAKGPVYSFFIAGFYLITRDWLNAGIIINLISGAVFVIFFFKFAQKMFNTFTASLASTALIFNYIFMRNSYQANSDILFMMFCMLAIYFLFEEKNKKTVLLSAVFASAAFLTRYNGAFIPAGVVIYYLLQESAFKLKLKKIGLWMTIFVISGLPWYIPNYIATGNPVKNDNHLNVMLEFYALSQENVSYETWDKALPREFNSLGEIILYDPVHFARHLSSNIVKYFANDILFLVEWRIGIFAVFGLLALVFMKPGKRKISYFIFGLIYFLVLTLVFYNERFSLFMLAFYLPLAVWPVTSIRALNRNKIIGYIPKVLLSVSVATYVLISTFHIYTEMKTNQDFFDGLKDLGIRLGQFETDSTQKVMARKPNIAFYAELQSIMFPGDIMTLDDLTAHAREYGIKYLAYSRVEAAMRPEFNFLFLSPEHTGLEIVTYNRHGAIWRILPDDPENNN